MAHCININHPDYIDLRQETGLHEDVLKAKIAIWMEENGNDRFPSSDELGIFNTMGITKTKQKDEFYDISKSDFDEKGDIIANSNAKLGKYGYYYELTAEQQKQYNKYIEKSGYRGSADNTSRGFELFRNLKQNVYLKKVRGKHYLYIELKDLKESNGVKLPYIYGRVKFPIDLVYHGEMQKYLDSFKEETPYISEQEQAIRRRLFKTKGISAAKAANFYIFNIRDAIFKLIKDLGGDIQYSDLSNMDEDTIERIKSLANIDKKIEDIKKRYQKMVEDLDEDELRQQIMESVASNYGEKEIQGIWSIINHLPVPFLRLLAFEYVNEATAFFAMGDARNVTTIRVPTSNSIKTHTSIIFGTAINVALRRMHDEGIINDEVINSLNSSLRAEIQKVILANGGRLLTYDELRKLTKRIKHIFDNFKSVNVEHKGERLSLYEIYQTYHEQAYNDILEYVNRQNGGIAKVVDYINKLEHTRLNKVFTNVTLGNFSSMPNLRFPIDYTAIAAHELGHALDFYLQTTNVNVRSQINNFIRELVALPEFENYLEKGLYTRGYNKSDTEEISADLYAWMMAKGANYDMSTSHLASMDTFMTENETMVEDIFKKVFGIEDKIKGKKGSSVVEYIKDLIRQLKEWVNKTLGTKLYSEKDGINPEPAGMALQRLLSGLENLTMRDSNFDINTILDSTTQTHNLSFLEKQDSKSTNIIKISDSLRSFTSNIRNYDVKIITSKRGNHVMIFKSPEGKKGFIKISNNLYNAIEQDPTINIFDMPVYQVEVKNTTMYVVGMVGSEPIGEIAPEDLTPKSEFPELKMVEPFSSPQKSRLTEEQRKIFTQLQNMGLVSKKTFSFKVGDKVKSWYFIPKSPVYSQSSTIYSRTEPTDFKKDYRKKQILDDLIEKNGWTFIRTRETENAIHVEIGDFSGQFPTRFESKASAPEVQSTPANAITKQKILNFLHNIGFTNIQLVKKLVHNGEEIEEDAYIDMMNGVMQIVEGKEDVTLPEEAMHILVELIQQSDPVLFRKLELEVIDYQLYRNLINSTYASDPNYMKDGKPDYAKLKKEAIAKVLVEYMIGSDENSSEALSKIKKVNSWWAAIKSWIRSIFTKYKNPFKEALNKLEENNKAFGEYTDLDSDEFFFAKSSKTIEERDKEFETTKTTFSVLKDSAARLGFSKIDHEYYKNGVLWDGKRVTGLVEDFKNSLFRNKPSDPERRAYWDSLAKDGQYVHSVFEDVFNSMVDGETGLLKDVESELTDALYPSEIERLIARRVKGYMRRMFATFPVGTRFLSETIVFSESKNLIGTVDFIAVEPNGKVAILDWKTVQSEAEERDYKKQQWEIQLSAYKEILKDNGIKEFSRIRAIPVFRSYRSDGKLKDLVLGDVDPLKEESRAKRPFISTEESSGNEIRDRLIIRLKGVYSTFIDMLKSGKLDSRLILDEINNAIFDLQVGKDLRHVISYIVDLHQTVRKLSKEIEDNKLTDVDTLNGFIADINIYKGVYDAISEIQALVTKDKTIDVIHRDKLRLKFNDLSDRMGVINSQLTDLLDSIAKQNGVYNLPSPEKVVRGFSVHLRAMGDHDIASIRLMYELVKNAYGQIDIETDEELKKLKALKYAFDGFVKNSGMKYQDAISLLVNKENGRLHSKINKEFYKKRKEVQDSHDSKTILNFVNENYDIANWKEWYDKELADNIKLWESGAMSEDAAENRKIIKAKRAKFEKEYNILKFPKTAFHVYNKLVWGRNIKEELWESDEFKTIKANPVLTDTYNFFVKKNKELVDIGAIAEYEAYTFVPNVLKGATDIFSVKDTNVLNKVANLSLQSYRNWKRKISINDYQLNFQGKIDQSTGEKIEERFIPYVDKLDNNYELTLKVADEIIPGFKNAKKEEKWPLIKKFRENEANDKLFAEKLISKRNMSFDIFTIYGLMSKEIAKEKYLQKSDDIFRGLRHHEKSKANFATNKYGKITYEGDRPVMSQKEGENYELFEKYYRYFVGGEAIQMDSDYSIKFSLKKLWNKLPIGKQYKFEITDEDNQGGISVSKFILWLNNSNTLKTLGLNFSSALSNLFGSSFSADKLYSSKISKDDLYSAWTKITSVGFYQTEEMKKQAALVDFFLPLLNNREAFKAEQLSVAAASRILSQDWLMWPQRKGDEIVQLNLFFAFIENTGIIDKKIVNLRELASSKVVPQDYWRKNSEERKEIDKKFKETLKELKEQYGITKLAEYKKETINGKEETIISLPDIARNSKDVADFRAQIQTLSKDATGSADEFDFQTYRLHMIGRLAGTFKNWIPRMGDVRWAELHYSQSHQQYVYGRFRMLYRGFTSNLFASILKTIPIPWVTGKVFKNAGKEDLIKRALDIYQKKKQEIEKLRRGEEFMTEKEFVDAFLIGFENSMGEVRIFTFLTLFILFGLMKGTGDDEPEEKAMKALIRRQIDKMSDEVGFFFNPPSIIDIAKNPFPVMMYVNDLKNLTLNLGKETLGMTQEAMGLEEQGADVRERAKPMKYLFKVLPVLKEIINYMPAYDSELGNDWGVKIADKRGI